MENEISLTTKPVGSIAGRFFVPSYQRGYRWSSNEVVRLLEDIFRNGNARYCLQPIVVRHNAGRYELVDGQQRLTTLFLIYQYMYKELGGVFDAPAFSLEYATRDKSETFLNDIDLSRCEENIDFWFMGNTYKTIKEWFSCAEKPKKRAFEFASYLEDNVSVIWYEVHGIDDDEAISLFARLNIGKIPLTSAELVKAMFLNRDGWQGQPEIKREKQEEISLQWDSMENELHRDTFWGFLTNEKQHTYQTRMDLLLELLTYDSQAESRDRYAAFFAIDAMSRDMPLNDIWHKLRKIFFMLQDWFEDHELYHKIGYLIASGFASLNEIFASVSHKKKDEIAQILDDRIRDSLLIGDRNYGDLDYTNRDDYKKISRLLLLFNVESVRQNGERTQWFPFDKFKYGLDNQAAWSLEHIHAQHAEGLNTQAAWKEWLARHGRAIKVLGEEKEYADLLDRIQAAVADGNLGRNDFASLQQEIAGVLSPAGYKDDLHSIANLALLDSSLNAVLSNSTFAVKRNHLLEKDKHGEYIPFCTRNVFLKYYTPSEECQLYFWSMADRKAYVDAINGTLKDYLLEQIKCGQEGA